jgi:hypothetical protein
MNILNPSTFSLNKKLAVNANFENAHLQGFLLSSTQQILDKWSAQVQDTLPAVRQLPDARYLCACAAFLSWLAKVQNTLPAVRQLPDSRYLCACAALLPWSAKVQNTRPAVPQLPDASAFAQALLFYLLAELNQCSGSAESVVFLAFWIRILKFLARIQFRILVLFAKKFIKDAPDTGFAGYPASPKAGYRRSGRISG